MKKLFIFLLITATFSVAGYSQTYHYDVDGNGVVTAHDITALYDYMLGDVSSVPGDEHEFVDLGLPNGTLWAMMNIGANSPEDYGDYFAWGETSPKEIYDWFYYEWCWGYSNTITKYCNNSLFGYNGFVDNKTELEPADDAATANWGANWRIPSLEQIQELLSNCTSYWTTKNGVNGRLFISSINSKSLFLPAAGYRNERILFFSRDCGCYWSNSIYTNDPSKACDLYIESDNLNWNDLSDRHLGISVRAVRMSKPYHYDVDGNGVVTAHDITALYDYMLGNVPAEPTHEYVDLGLPSGTLWATTNVGASVPEGHGDYFAWGETSPKDVYGWSTYMWCLGSRNTLIKYCINGNYGYNGFVDNKTELDSQDDAATVNWGPEWRMPSVEQFQELVDNCSAQWTTRNGVDGCLFTSYINDASLFLPTGGYKIDAEINEAWLGFYWSRTLKSENFSNANSSYAYTMHFGLDYSWCSVGIDTWGRQHGRSIRPVRISQK